MVPQVRQEIGDLSVYEWQCQAVCMQHKNRTKSCEVML